MSDVNVIVIKCLLCPEVERYGGDREVENPYGGASALPAITSLESARAARRQRIQRGSVRVGSVGEEKKDRG